MSNELELRPWASARQSGGKLTSWQAAERFREYDFPFYLDVGCGKKRDHHGMIGKKAFTTDLFPPADFVGDYLTTDVQQKQGPWPAIWCSHVLEHQLNVQAFLGKIKRDLANDGVLCITVPPAHPEFMGGHLSLWTEGMLIYRLVLAGFNCSEARVGVYDRNITVIVKNGPAIPTEVYEKLVYDKGDIETLAPYFPVPVKQGSPMKFGNVSW